MRNALLEAKKGLGHTSPNPAVGAVLVSEGCVISKGYHRAAGKPHAEIECLNKAPAAVAVRSDALRDARAMLDLWPNAPPVLRQS